MIRWLREIDDVVEGAGLTTFERRCFQTRYRERLPGLVRECEGGDFREAMKERLPGLVRDCLEMENER